MYEADWLVLGVRARRRCGGSELRINICMVLWEAEL